jgi:cytidine deaminase
MRSQRRPTGSSRGLAPREWEELLAAAREASQQAYAPYSNLRVGAALRGRRGRIFAGCNVENSSFGLTICAERAALFRAVAEGERELDGLVIYTLDAGPLSPCGACRQALAEFCAQLPILSVGRGDLRREFELSELLPRAFAWPAGEAESEPESPSAKATGDKSPSPEATGDKSPSARATGDKSASAEATGDKSNSGRRGKGPRRPAGS